MSERSNVITHLKHHQFPRIFFVLTYMYNSNFYKLVIGINDFFDVNLTICWQRMLPIFREQIC